MFKICPSYGVDFVCADLRHAKKIAKKMVENNQDILVAIREYKGEGIVGRTLFNYLYNRTSKKVVVATTEGGIQMDKEMSKMIAERILNNNYVSKEKIRENLHAVIIFMQNFVGVSESEQTLKDIDYYRGVAYAFAKLLGMDKEQLLVYEKEVIENGEQTAKAQ